MTESLVNLPIVFSIANTRYNKITDVLDFGEYISVVIVYYMPGFKDPKTIGARFKKPVNLSHDKALSYIRENMISIVTEKVRMVCEVLCMPGIVFIDDTSLLSTDESLGLTSCISGYIPKVSAIKPGSEEYDFISSNIPFDEYGKYLFKKDIQVISNSKEQYNEVHNKSKQKDIAELTYNCAVVVKDNSTTASMLKYAGYTVMCNNSLVCGQRVYKALNRGSVVDNVLPEAIISMLGVLCDNLDKQNKFSKLTVHLVVPDSTMNDEYQLRINDILKYIKNNYAVRLRFVEKPISVGDNLAVDIATKIAIGNTDRSIEPLLLNPEVVQ